MLLPGFRLVPLLPRSPSLSLLRRLPPTLWTKKRLLSRPLLAASSQCPSSARLNSSCPHSGAAAQTWSSIDGAGDADAAAAAADGETATTTMTRRRAIVAVAAAAAADGGDGHSRAVCSP